MSLIDLTGNVQYVYETIPKSWVSLSQKLFYLFTEYGLESIKDCKTDCTKQNYNLIRCYNMFCSAVAAYNVGRNKEASFIITYIKSQLQLLYPNMIFGTKSLYLAGGLEISDVVKEENKISELDTMIGSYQITVEDGNYMYLVFSRGLTYNRITFNGFDIPFDDLYLKEIDGEVYQVLKSSNTYKAGNYIIKIE